MEINIRLTGIGGIAAEVTSIVKIIYYIFSVLFVFSLVVSLTNKNWNFIKPKDVNIFLAFLHFNHAKQMKSGKEAMLKFVRDRKRDNLHTIFQGFMFCSHRL
jgi:uncharacterized membrane protein YtjA (UPF0391 family)